MTKNECDPVERVVSRRSFLKLGGATIVTLTLPFYLQKNGLPATFKAQMVEYPRQTIGQISALRSGDPVGFSYPWDHPAAANFLIKLDEPAGGGIGPDMNVVAFNSFCPVAGPCPLHLTTFDLTRHGMVISGHATQGLPQIVLEADGDDIVATGVMGLIFGYYDNRVDPNA